MPPAPTDPSDLAYWMTTNGGHRIHFANPAPDSINLRDILIGLSRAPRFVGHLDVFVSVAHHSILASYCAYLLGCTPRQILVALMHDAHEAYTGDLPRGFKLLLPAIGCIQHRIQRAIHERFNLETFDEDIAMICTVDDICMYTEYMAYASDDSKENFTPEKNSLLVPDNIYDQAERYLRHIRHMTVPQIIRLFTSIIKDNAEAFDESLNSTETEPEPDAPQETSPNDSDTPSEPERQESSTDESPLPDGDS